ncbi:amino acid transporter [Eremomyces bilateralis CBS 781.70]|uniref:Amino acid transporter n=1 Tax=Eremomyces bilateralis CBS 781.70 TaxID=1392243 RepID=A0A6G1G3U4_9PEZI|nr:amino acid transporter [Eremomyces bilateralis CBS 781.70]KAF1812576.1 amino acid transporter [Eremomyces bilateralis CBS 781.70]
MKKSIGAVTMISLCFNICNSWAGLSASSQIALIQGGPATLLYGMMITASAYMAIALSMGELASVYPTAGGQYHFVSILAPKRFNRGLSYTCGILANLSWIAIGAAIIVIPSQQIPAIVTYYHPEFVLQKWHAFLIYESFGFIVVLYNVLALKKLPRTHDIGFATTIIMFIISTLGLFIRSSPKASHTFVWTTFSNSTGWPDGVCFLTALLTTSFIFAGLDAALHMAEEAPNPRTSVPLAGVSAIGIGFITAFTFGIAILYSISDFDEVLAIEGYLPFEINRVGLRSDAGAVGLLIAGVIMTFFVLNAVIQTASRITWALARDNALVFSGLFRQIHPTLEVPVSSILVVWGVLAACGLLILASDTAFNALVSSCVTLQLLSFIMPTALVLYQRRSTTYLPRNRAFGLPNWAGWIINVWAVCMPSILCIFFLFPAFVPVTAESMNYNVVILGIAAFFGTVNWFCYARKHYQGPRIVFHD